MQGYDAGRHAHGLWAAGSSRGGSRMDLVYLGVVVLLFALSWGLVRLCEKL
ncbi:MAG TPA: hypothetical protein VNL77_22855 [Roseiflexaceae bacterium]|nr:hypothetical protein [Roseiflexaceae bacterium]